MTIRKLFPAQSDPEVLPRDETIGNNVTDMMAQVTVSLLCRYEPGNPAEQQTRERCRTRNLGHAEGYEECLLDAVIIVTTAYRRTRLQSQLEIATYTFLVVLIDDFRASILDLEAFAPNLLRRLP
ncbi:hypothetical protein NM688_g84 [Phlebia brevispora]|uniref:Uncharacterized protein n=1 Tax=Phlebia brevispora TaxID=194682 RepID=A0ACC1TF00_9APHY|nr:hypothetical protein NM688_g84 [Phlebia brevispora]